MEQANKINIYSLDDFIWYPHRLNYLKTHYSVILIYVYVCVCVCICIYVHTHIYIDTHTVFTLPCGSVCKTFFSCPMFQVPTTKLIILCYLFSYISTLCPYLVMTNQFSHHCPYKTTGKVVLFSVLIFMFLGSVWEDEGIRTY